jgi:glycosyltransferase involved in cell wall biosynthesis
MSTYNQICGIADYTAGLVKHIPKEHEVTIIAPKLDTGVHHSLKAVGPEDPRVHRLYNASVWDGIIGIDLAEIGEIADKSDVFHLQFQDAVFHHEWLWWLIERIKNKTKLVITLHDTCLGKIWPMLGSFKEIITMKPEVQRQIPRAKLIGMPTYNTPPKLKGFGLGRSRHGDIEKVCAELGYTYEFAHAEKKWYPIDELITWLRDSDGIVLYYNDVDTAGSSAAARTALSTRRPVFVNKVTWFNDLPEDVVIKFADNEELKTKLQQYLEKPYLNTNSFDRIAQEHISIYNSIS